MQVIHQEVHFCNSCILAEHKAGGGVFFTNFRGHTLLVADGDTWQPVPVVMLWSKLDSNGIGVCTLLKSESTEWGEKRADTKDNLTLPIS